MRERSGDGDFLELDGDRVGLGRADPDAEVTVGGFFPEDDYPLVVHQADPDALNRHLNQANRPPNPTDSSLDTRFFGCQRI